MALEPEGSESQAGTSTWNGGGGKGQRGAGQRVTLAFGKKRKESRPTLSVCLTNFEGELPFLSTSLPVAEGRKEARLLELASRLD